MPLSPFKLERYFARYEFSAEYLLCTSDCESLSIGELLALEPDAAARFHQHWLGYTESRGAPSLRAEISRIYTRTSPEQVLVHSGAEEAIFLFMHAVLAPGDHLVVHSPCYQSLTEIAASLGCELTRWQARPGFGWSLSLDELRRSIRPNTRLVVVNLPHNPTGFLMPASEFDELIRIVEEHGLLLFSDEVYRESEHDPALRLPAACDLSERAVSLGVLSKTYGLAGLRIGWLASRDPSILSRVAGIKDYTTICSSAPSEFLAELALRHRQRLALRSLETILANLALLDEFFDRHPDTFAWRRPSAGPIAFPRLLTGDVDLFCRDLVERSGVLLLPGSVYDYPGNYFRIGFGRRSLPQALERLEKYLERNG